MLIQRFARTRTILVAASALSIFSVGHMLYDLTAKYKRVGQIQSGLQICGSRANQSYTASVIGDASSIYLDSNFTSATEECFAEASTLVEDFKSLPTAIAKKMNTLVSNVHWFHESLRSTGNGFTVKASDDGRNTSSKYSAVESEIGATTELIDSHGEQLNNSLSNLKVALFFSGLVLLVCGGWEAIERRKLKQAQSEIEDEAFAELISEDHSTATKVEEIIVQALELNEMVHCSKLLTTYRQNVLKSFENLSTYTPMKDLVTPMAMVTSTDEVETEIKANQVWEESEAVEEKEEVSCDIEPIASKIVDHLSNKLIAEGIMVDMDLADSFVNGDAESLEQVLYYVVLDALKNTNYASDKKVVINGKGLGSVYNLEVTSCGQGRESIENTSIEISKEIIADLNGRMEVVNYYNDQKEVAGRKVRVILKTAQKERAIITPAQSEKTLVRLEKGTKREILERLNA